MNFQMALPMPFRSLRSLALLPLIDLPAMNFHILISDSLILRASEARCSMELCNKTAWKFLSQESEPYFVNKFKGCVWIIAELNIKHAFTMRYVEGRVHSQSTLLPCIRRGVSHLADLIILTLGFVFEFDIAWRIVRLVFIYFVAFSLDANVVFFFTFA